MFIDDEELRSLYRDASSDHLNTLEAGLLHLEKHPQDTARIKELLRATHSLKGDSRMLGVKDAETLTHQIENLLSTVEQGERTLTPELCDSLYQGFDAVRQVVNEAITGDPSDISVFHALAQLMKTEEDHRDDPQPVQESVQQLAPAIAVPTAINTALSEDISSDISEALTRELMMDQQIQNICTPESEFISETAPTLKWLADCLDEASPFSMSEPKDSLNQGTEERAQMEGRYTPESEFISETVPTLKWLADSLDEASLCSMPKSELPLSHGAEEIANREELAESLVESVEDLLGDDTDATQVKSTNDSHLVPLTTHPPQQEQENLKDLRQIFEQYILPSETSPSGDIETVRVRASKLDTLMTQAGELSVTQRRISQRMDDVEAMQLLWEKWTQETLASRGQIDQLKVTISEDAFAVLQKSRQLNDDYLCQFGTLLNQLYASANEDAAQLNSLSNEMESGILQLRQLPLNSLFAVFPRMVRDLAKQQGKIINFVVEGEEIQTDKRIIEEMKSPLNHLIRNAIDHGIETPEERVALGKSSTATLTLKAYQQGNQMILDVTDDGRGLNLETIKHTALQRGLYSEAELTSMSPECLQSLIFSPGFSTRSTVTEISGRGVGLDVVRVNVERLKGTIQVQSTPSQGCTFRFTLKTNVGTTSALILEVNQTPYALPLEAIDRMMRIDRHDIFTLESRPTITIEDHPVSVVWLRDLLDLPLLVETQVQARSPSPLMTCVVLKVGSERLGILVDKLIDQQDIVLKAHSKLLKRVRNITGATILGTGQVCMVLSPQDLVQSAQGMSGAIAGIERMISPPPADHRVLLVEDSPPIRIQVRRILEGAGYRVTTATDGLDGLKKLNENRFDAVVSDVEMPNLDGLGLTTHIRQEQKYENLPIILVTTLAKEEDQRRGALAGANAYITKGDFDQRLLIQTLGRLINHG